MRPFISHRSQRHLVHAFPKWLALLLLLGCTHEKGDYERFNIQPTAIEITTTDTWKSVLNQDPLANASDADPAMGHLIRDILKLGPWPPQDQIQQTLLDTAWSSFIHFEGTRIGVEGIDSILATPGGLSRGLNQLSDAFGRWRVHFPNAPVPSIDLAFTGFNYSVYPTDELLLIGCEFFLGAEHPSVRSLPPAIYPRYMQERMVPEHLVGDALRGWLLVHFQDQHYDPQGRLAEELLYWGKVLYLARCLAPDIPTHILLDWTPDEWNWAVKNERTLWTELRQEAVLYNRNKMDIQRWTSDAPFTKAGSIPQESPDRIGWFIGLRWVEDLMTRRTEMDLPSLMNQQEVLPFLQAYRPGS